jgi:hypothetical protein
MSVARHPSWDTVLASLSAQQPRRFPVPGHPHLYVHVEPGINRLSLLVPWKPATVVPVSPLREISFSRRSIDGETFLAAGTSTSSLQQECYSFLLTVADAIQLKAMSPEAALVQQLQAWGALLQPASRLSKEEEIGLIGELWVLHRLVSATGPSAVLAWVAAEPESHDFRFGSYDLEVKTTTARERRHTINDPSQVTPLPGHDLWFASLQIAPSGRDSGRTLPESIERLMELLSGDGAAQARFQAVVTARGYLNSDAPHYPTRFGLRTAVQLIPVAASFPALTRDVLESALGRERAGRVPGLSYMVRLDGLGFEDGTDSFFALLPPSSAGELV